MDKQTVYPPPYKYGGNFSTFGAIPSSYLNTLDVILSHYTDGTSIIYLVLAPRFGYETELREGTLSAAWHSWILDVMNHVSSFRNGQPLSVVVNPPNLSI